MKCRSVGFARLEMLEPADFRSLGRTPPAICRPHCHHSPSHAGHAGAGGARSRAISRRMSWNIVTLRGGRLAPTSVTDLPDRAPSAVCRCWLVASSAGFGASQSTPQGRTDRWMAVKAAHVRGVTAGCFLRVPIRARPRRCCPTQAGPRVNQEARQRSGGTPRAVSPEY
jgi:hypothetical protein